VGKFLWSQTALKDLEREETCPTRWKAQWLDRAFPSISNENMDRGKYFEQILFGYSANKDEKVSDLPRLDNGTKSTDQLRIEAQAERGKRILFDKQDPEYLGFNVISTQLALKFEDEAGTADIVASDKDGNIWILDVKLTKDLTNTRTEYGWGNDLSQMDLLQLVHYAQLYEKIYGTKVNIAYLIFDYASAKRIKFAEIRISQSRFSERTTRFTAAKNVIKQYSERGWTFAPSSKECENCFLSCPKRKEASKIIKEQVNY
jgi:CRISPR/Cas system-associated exonuclease Cas4 (RecB family)